MANAVGWLQALLEASEEGVLALDLDARLLAHNRRLFTLWHLAPQPGQALEALLARGAEQAVDSGLFLTGARALLSQDGEDDVRMKDGRLLHRRSAPLQVDGKLVGRALFCRDVSAVRRAEEAIHSTEQLAVADRLSVVGTVSAGVAHALNDPLAYLSANLSYLADELRGLEKELISNPATSEAVVTKVRELEGALRESRAGTGRLREVVADLKGFSRLESEAAAPVDLRRVIEGCGRLMGPSLHQRATLQLELGEVPPVAGQEARVSQVVLTLLILSAQGIPEGSPQEHTIRVTTRAEGRHVAIDLWDSGTPASRSTLGLVICRNLISSLGGTFLPSREGARGNSARVLLPAVRRAGAEDGLPRRTGHRRRLLVVDDEPLIGATFVRLLSAHHDVVAVVDPREALTRMEAGERFDLVISDMMMPRMTGMAFHAELARRFPQVANEMVFLTGGGNEEVEVFLASVPNSQLEKPFDLQQLRSLLETRFA